MHADRCEWPIHNSWIQSLELMFRIEVDNLACVTWIHNFSTESACYMVSRSAPPCLVARLEHPDRTSTGTRYDAPTQRTEGVNNVGVKITDGVYLGGRRESKLPDILTELRRQARELWKCAILTVHVFDCFG